MTAKHDRATGRGVASRIRGQAKLRERSARRLRALTGDLLATHRYANHRARTDDARARAARAIAELELARDAINRAIDALDTTEPCYQTRPVRKRMAKMALQGELL